VTSWMEGRLERQPLFLEVSEGLGSEHRTLLALPNPYGLASGHANDSDPRRFP